MHCFKCNPLIRLLAKNPPRDLGKVTKELSFLLHTKPEAI